MPRLAAFLARLFSVGSIPPCAGCGEPMVVTGEQRIAAVPPVFELTLRCPGCGAEARVRQVLESFD